MNILIISHEFPPSGGGAGIVAKQYCNYFIENDHSVTLLSATAREKNSNLFKVIKPTNIKLLWPIAYYFKLKELNLENYDRIILNDIGATIVAGLFFNTNILAKSIIVLHGQEPEQVYENPSCIYKIINVEKYYHRSILLSKKIIAVSFYMKSKFIDSLHKKDKKIIESKIIVAYSGVDLKKSSHLKNKNKNKKIKIITVSRIEKDKGIDDIIYLSNKFKSMGLDFDWTVIGSGSYLKKIKKITLKSNLNDSVFFIGKIPHDNLSSYYEMSDVFVLLSRLKESFGLVYLESQLCGCPAIGLNQYGVKESIFHNKSGFLVNNIEEIIPIISNKLYEELVFDVNLFSEFSNSKAKERINRIIHE
ncbi:hypothetical protein CO695_05025 [Providencia alcalifaciens]|uniref:Glycosyltransferase, group 1 family protein n=1 Tax=Providencia alcalifaciens DSM 30120 TaxID=520999 RepID=B6XJS8_9GAMM|nr:glycosyltransferase family 4 protein [Providencia alcalifaciens]ATG15699.1 hypothetical protein CO695_05025 [Providencia alcalifaciens]EEB44285.1 glycosyltransferase, group 1 family protein [Providencia alcalifaciens DSM 30120]